MGRAHLAWLGIAASTVAIDAATAEPTVAAKAPRAPATSACGQDVGLAGERKPLSQVLRRLSSTLGFKLEYWSADDPMVSLAGGLRAVDSMTALSQQANMIVRYSPDPRCAGQWRVDTVWVLPSEARTTVGAAVELPAAPARALQPVAPPAPPDPSLKDYMRAHGVLPRK